MRFNEDNVLNEAAAAEKNVNKKRLEKYLSHYNPKCKVLKFVEFSNDSSDGIYLIDMEEFGWHMALEYILDIPISSLFRCPDEAIIFSVRHSDLKKRYGNSEGLFDFQKKG